tara:strand:+ start:864 stop:1298 length:435 start_codon:yes stop_codon:yes gene_type:complete
MEFNNIYIDGTIHSYGNALWAQKEQKRVWFIISKLNMSDKKIKTFVQNFRDCCGSLCHFENGVKKKHISFGIPKNCTSLIDPIDFYFKTICTFEENHMLHIISLTKICEDFEPCLKCNKCSECEKIAQTYGLYDVVQFSGNNEI